MMRRTQRADGLLLAFFLCIQSVLSFGVHENLAIRQQQQQRRRQQQQVRLDMAAQTTQDDSRVFLLGAGFTQFLLAQQLGRSGIQSVAMTDVATIDSLRQNWITTKLCTLVTNGETEWEDEAATCTSLVVCPEVANIPGRTVRALMSQMPLVNRIVVLTPAGTTRPESTKPAQSNNWL